MSFVERRIDFLSQAKNEINDRGRGSEIEYKHFLLEFILDGSGIDELDEEIFDLKDAIENEKIIRERANYLFQNVSDAETLKAIFDLVESVFNFSVFSDLPRSMEKKVYKESKDQMTRKARKFKDDNDKKRKNKRLDALRELFPNHEKLKESRDFAEEIRSKVFEKANPFTKASVKKWGYGSQTILKNIKALNRERGFS